MCDMSGKSMIFYWTKEGTTGFWGLRDVPVHPKDHPNVKSGMDQYSEPLDTNGFWQKRLNDYAKALESCKEKKLEIVNPEVLESWSIGEPFDLPIGYEFKEEDIPLGDVKEIITVFRKVLRLVKTETKPVREDGYYWIRPAGGFWIIGQWYQKNEAFTFLDGKKLMNWPEHSLEVNETRIYRVPQPEPEESQTLYTIDEVKEILHNYHCDMFKWPREKVFPEPNWKTEWIDKNLIQRKKQ